jgi:hypothetical protein
MLDIRREVELPHVTDTDPQVVAKFAELFLATVECELPGAGITHDSEATGMTHKDVHDLHSGIVVAAASQCEPELGQLEVVKKRKLPGNGNIGFHVDPNKSEGKTCLRGLNLCLRLHTADTIEGAEVTLVNSRRALNMPYGDSELYRYFCDADFYRELIADAETLGYEEEERFMNQRDMLIAWDADRYDPLYADPEFYSYREDPLCSMLFRVSSHLVPRTLHRFDALHPGAVRDFYFTDYCLQTQSL